MIYEPLVAFEVTNFMALEHILLEFDDTNILNLCGLNDAGKSATTRAFEVLFYDAYSQSQAKYIRTGATKSEITAYFGSMKDGLRVTKIKTNTGSSIWSAYKGTELLYTNKRETGLIAVDGVPQPIQELLGVIFDEATGAYLNVRRNTDTLFLIKTSGGDNYKILNSILQSDMLSEAARLLIEDRNKHNTEVQIKTNSFNTLEQQYELLDVAPKEATSELQKRLDSVTDLNMKMLQLKKCMDYLTLIRDSVVHDELGTLGTNQIAEIATLINVAEQARSPVYADLTTLTLDQYSALDTLLNLRTQSDCSVAEELKVISGTLNRYSELSSLVALIDTTANKTVAPEVQLCALEKCEVMHSLMGVFMDYKNKDESLRSLIEEHTACASELKALADAENIRICTNCGAVVMN